MTSTVLVGMNNPLSSDPQHALFPHPPGCSGHRLWRMAHSVCGASRGEYLRLERRNVLAQRTWLRALARQRGDQLRGVLVVRGRAAPLQVLVMGQAAWTALGLPAGADIIHPVMVDGVRWRRVPHPSGRSRFYNEQAHRLVVGLLLEEVMRG